MSDSPRVGNGLYNGLVVSWLFDRSDARLQRPGVDFVKLSSPHVIRAPSRFVQKAATLDHYFRTTVSTSL